MTIKDRKRTRFNRIGIIRLGCKVFWCKNGHKNHPTRWNGDGRQACEKCGKMRTGLTDRNTSPFQPGHFVLWDAPDVLAFYAAQGIEEKDVRELDVLFPFAERDKNFVASYQVWAGGDCVCQGDGEYVGHAIPTKTHKDDRGWHVKKADGETLVANGTACRSFEWNGTNFAEGDHVPCGGSGEEKLYPHCNLCKLNSMLKVMMSDPELFRVGYYRISTGSGRNYDHLDTMFDILPENVQGIYFKLRLVEEQTRYTDDDGKSHKTMKWFLHLEPDPDYVRDLYAHRAARQVGRGVIVEEPAQIEAQAGVLNFNSGGDHGDGIEWYEDNDGNLVPYNLDGVELCDDGHGGLVPCTEVAEPPTDEPQATPPPSPSEPRPLPIRPAFENWQPGQWTTFCKTIADLMDCFETKADVWALLLDMHGNPPEVNYDQAWNTCLDHCTAPMVHEPPQEQLAF